jgi:hypothetical protein
MTTTTNSARIGPDEWRADFGRRLDGIGWGLFLLMTGLLWLVPSDRVPPGTWLIGTGALLLGLNAVRHLNGLAINVLTAALGALALAGGFADLGGLELPLLAISLVAVGAAVLFKALRESRA